MSDLVDKQSVYDTLTEYYRHRLQTQHKALRDALSRVPSVQLKRKPGHWIDGGYDTDGMHYIKCSVCCSDVIYGDWDYCPNCGAEMRGENNG